MTVYSCAYNFTTIILASEYIKPNDTQSGKAFIVLSDDMQGQVWRHPRTRTEKLCTTELLELQTAPVTNYNLPCDFEHRI